MSSVLEAEPGALFITAKKNSVHVSNTVTSVGEEEGGGGGVEGRDASYSDLVAQC